jgi:FkbM family methyltransferase
MQQQTIKAFNPVVVKSDIFEFQADEIETSGGRTLKYAATTKHSRKRNRSLLTKEPTTIVWLETFARDEVLFDVGANVGMYSIYGAIVGARVFSFEPEALNYAELNKNIYANGLHDRVTAYCMAIGNSADVSVLHLGGFGVAWSHHDFGENRWTANKTFGTVTTERDRRFQQGCVSFSLDELVGRGVIPAPNHIKIDVDGFEWKVFEGARALLGSDQLKSVLLEVDFTIPESVALVDKMVAMGWHYSPDQLRLNQHEIISFEKFETRKRDRKGGQNYIFYKDKARYDECFRAYAEVFVPPNPPK